MINDHHHYHYDDAGFDFTKIIFHLSTGSDNTYLSRMLQTFGRQVSTLKYSSYVKFKILCIFIDFHLFCSLHVIVFFADFPVPSVVGQCASKIWNNFQTVNLISSLKILQSSPCANN